jgi:formylmethanofuran dehydrogenase subunit B
MSLPGGQQTPSENLVEHATCLGCGCACDDIVVRLDAGRIVDTANACPLGIRWFGDGTAPSAIRVNGNEAALNDALTAIVDLLAPARRPLVFLAPEITCEAQREAIALADRLHGVVDTISSVTALASILASQERGRAGATLGEIRNRADVIVFWGVDPNERYPRYWTRYAPVPVGVHVDQGRSGRRVVAVDIASRRGPDDADVRIPVGEREEVALLTAAAAIVRKPDIAFDDSPGARARQLVTQFLGARYVTIVADGEPPLSSEHRPTVASSEVETTENDPRPHFLDPQRSSALIALAQALNGTTRCALSTLRAGGNRSGAEAVLTAHTGFPTGVSFIDGHPAYRPHEASQSADAVLIVGDASHLPTDLLSRFAQGPLAIIGPRASSRSALVTIDTGVAGIHVNGTALRMDDVPLRLRPSIHRGLDPAEVLAALTRRVPVDADRNSDLVRSAGTPR